jgi:hypothetical protein
VTDSAERGDQHRITTGLVFESGNNSDCKFSVVTTIPGIAIDVSGAGFPSELKSTALAKLGGRLITESCHQLVL